MTHAATKRATKVAINNSIHSEDAKNVNNKPNVIQTATTRNINSNTSIKNETSQRIKSSRYIPPHLRGKGIKKYSPKQNNHQHDENKIDIKNNENASFKWYNNEQIFESKLGETLESLQLNDASYIDSNKLNELTNINRTRSNEWNPIILYVIGPPSIGKSTIYTSYLKEFGINNAVNTDGDIVRKSHFGIQKYLQLTNKLNIGYNSFFTKYVQKWSGKWKIEIREKAMKERKKIIAFSTCHRFNDIINEMDIFIEYGYHIKILFVCGEYNKCKKIGIQRARENGRKYLNGTYSVSMQGSMDVIDYLLKNKIIHWRDLIVVNNEYKMNKPLQRMYGGWDQIKYRVLIPMKKRAIKQMYQNYE